LHLPFRFILARRIEKAVHAQSDQQHLGAGPSDHGAGEGAASAQQQDQSAIGGEQQRNREKYGGWKPISKPGHSCSIDAGLINELSPSQSSKLKRRYWPILNANCPQYRQLQLAYTVPKSSRRSMEEELTHLQRIGSGENRSG
jgi:hypothetical protein